MHKNVEKVIKDAHVKISSERLELEDRLSKDLERAQIERRDPKDIQDLIPEDLRPRAFGEISPHLIDVRRATKQVNDNIKALEDQYERYKKQVEELIRTEEDLVTLQNVYVPPYGGTKR